MATTTTMTRHQKIDRDRITSDWQVGYWAMKLGKTEEMIEEAIDEVGDRAADVQQYFFCGPPAPARAVAPSAPRAKREEKVRPPILDWLLSPSLCGKDSMHSLRLAD